MHIGYPYWYYSKSRNEYIYIHCNVEMSYLPGIHYYGIIINKDSGKMSYKIIDNPTLNYYYNRHIDNIEEDNIPIWIRAKVLLYITYIKNFFDV